MKKRFIILIDFSTYSGNLLMYAYEWSRQVNAELLLVHQPEMLIPSFSDNETKKQIIQDAKDEALKNLKELAGRMLPGHIKVSYEISVDPLRDTVANFTDDAFENLIFIGLKGTGLFKKIFLGSEAIQIIENTNNIVVAMPGEINRFSHEKIFVAVNEKHPVNMLQLNNFFNFIDKSSTAVTFFYLARPNEETREIKNYLEELAGLFKDRFNTTSIIYKGNNSFDEIKKVINNKIDELLIVQKGSRLLVDQFFRRFLINELVYEGQTPLIVLP